MCEVACYSSRASKPSQTSVIIPIYKKGDRREYIIIVVSLSLASLE